MKAFEFSGYDILSISASDSVEPQLAARIAHEAAIAADATANPTLKATAHFWAGKRAATAGYWKEAAQELSAADKIFGRLPASSEMDGYRAESKIGQASIEIASGQVDKAERLLKAARQNLPMNSRFQLAVRYFHVLSELCRAKGLAQQEERSLRAEVALADIALRSLSTDYDRLTWIRDIADTYGRLAQLELANHSSPQRAFELVEGLRSAPWRDSEQRPQNFDVNAIEAHPPRARRIPIEAATEAASGATLVSYMLLPESLASWAISAKGFWSAQTSIKPDHLREIADAFHDAIGEPSSDPRRLEQLSRELYRILIAPLESHIPPGTAVLYGEPPGLEGIPIQALLNARGDYFGATRSIAVWPSAAGIRNLRPAIAIAAATSALVIGAPTISRDASRLAPPLPDAGHEASDIAGMFYHSILLTGRRALSSEIEREIPNAVVFHFAGHSIVSAGRVGLMLAPDGIESESGNILKAESLRKSQIENCSLVVLSACSTAGMDAAGPADPGSLVRGFLRAGVPRIIATRWDVDSTTTADFMRFFYRNLLLGNSAGEALRQAAATVRQSPATSQPYYWAAFQLYGRN